MLFIATYGFFLLISFQEIEEILRPIEEIFGRRKSEGSIGYFRSLGGNFLIWRGKVGIFLRKMKEKLKISSLEPTKYACGALFPQLDKNVMFLIEQNL